MHHIIEHKGISMVWIENSAKLYTDIKKKQKLRRETAPLAFLDVLKISVPDAQKAILKQKREDQELIRSNAKVKNIVIFGNQSPIMGSTSSEDSSSSSVC